MQRLKAAQYQTPSHMSQPLLALLRQTIQPDIAKRYSAVEALKDPWCLGTDQTPDAVDVLVRQMSAGPIAQIEEGVGPDEWMAKLEICRAAHESQTAAEPEPEDGGLRRAEAVSFADDVEEQSEGGSVLFC